MVENVGLYVLKALVILAPYYMTTTYRPAVRGAGTIFFLGGGGQKC